MRDLRSYAPVVALALLAMAPSFALAQAPSASPSPRASVARDSLVANDVSHGNSNSPTQRLAGSARISLHASALRVDGGGFTSYGVAASAAPFIGEHVQVGIVPSFTRSEPAQLRPLQISTTALIANYVFGGDPRWRGYVGGYGSFSTQTNAPSVHGSGVQGGALFFFTPAIALRSELRYREITSPGEQRHGSEVALVTLDPYVSGGANAIRPTSAGIGVLDLALLAYHARYPSYHASGLSGTIAPYLARWAQLGVEGEAERISDFGGVTFYRVRGFGRGYVPLTTRTQPFAEGFAESSTDGGNDGGLTDYGGALGVREMLNANVALDFGLRRTLRPRETLGPADHRYSVRFPGSASLFAGVITRLGRAR